MNILYLIGALLFLIILGYPYVILVIANKQQGITRRIGQGLSGFFVLVLVLLILLYQTGIVQMPGVRLMGERATPRMQRGMSGYVTGMMLEDEKAIDEFISILKSNPQLFDNFKQKLGQ
jgi:hypothetical protein